jgi:electron transfer flavoprotein beta subunit
MVLNPYDEVALEEAVRWKENGNCTEVVALNIGGPEGDEILRHCLAVGANQAVRMEPVQPITPFGVASMITEAACTLSADAIVCGIQSSDEEGNQVGPMTAALLGWPLISAACKTLWEQGELETECRREGGMDTIRTSPPFVMTASLQLNTPRYARLPAIVAAKRQTITVLANIQTVATPFESARLDLPAAKPPVQMLADPQELARLLRSLPERQL